MPLRARARAMLAAALLAALSACASAPDDSRPRDVENACAMFRERPHWAEAVREAERRWGAPAHVQLAIIWRESAFVADARPFGRPVMGVLPAKPLSSAYGFSQAIDGTWDWYLKETGARKAERDRFADAADFVGWYMAKTTDMNGVAMGDAFAQYLNYHEGHTGFRRGGWQSKDWLLRAAAEVSAKAEVYRAQMARCT